MKVAEAIQKLGQLDPDMELMTAGPDAEYEFCFRKVDIVQEGFIADDDEYEFISFMTLEEAKNCVGDSELRKVAIIGGGE